jgi:ParB-like chromosome segregation protein Spo0J
MSISENDMTTQEQREALSKAERKGRKEIEKQARVLEALTIEYVDPQAIKPNPWNPNRQSEHDFELLLRSMEEDGFTQPVVCVRISEEDLAVDKIAECGYLSLGDIMIVDGEHRWRAGTKLGYPKIPIVVTPMTASQAMIATLRHNRARGSEDIGLASEVLRDLQALGSAEWAMDSLMMDDTEFNRMLEIAEETAAEMLADEEHSASWEPDKGVDPEGEKLTVEAQVGSAPSGDWTKAASPAAVEAARDREKRMSEAKTEEQRQMVRKDTDKTFHRVSLVFAGEEAEIVKEILGGAPAETLVNLCREKAGIEQQLKETGWIAIDTVLGTRMIPADAAAVLAQARDKMKAEGVISEKNGFQVVEYLAAEYLAGA